MTCLECDSDIPQYAWINNEHKRLVGRKYCLTCSPYQSFNGRRKIRGNHSGKNYDVTNYRIVNCYQCHEDFKFYKGCGGTLTLCMRCYNQQKRHEMKKKLITLLGGQCNKCGYNKSIAALHFHHVNDKILAVSEIMGHKWEKVLEEAKKCVILCANCHAEEHFMGV